MNWNKQVNKRTNRYLAHLRKIAKYSEFVESGKAKPVPYATGRINRMRGVLTYKITKEDWIDYLIYSKGFRDSYKISKIYRNFYRQ